MPGRPEPSLESALPADLVALLEHGPFHEALGAAVAHRGLTLSRLQHRLAAQGKRVSVPTLSCWVRGTRRPERAPSLAALAELERVLGVPTRSLSDLLGRPRRRGRIDTRPVTDDAIWPGADSLSAVLKEMDLSRPHLRVVSAQVRQTVDAERVERRVRHLNVVEATRDDLGRTRLTLARLHGRSDRLEVRGVAGVSTGARRTTNDGFVVTELLLDTVLDRGDRTVLEYEVTLDPAGQASTECTVLFYRPAKMAVVEVFFDPTVVPVRCHVLHKPAGKREQRTPARISAAGVLRTVQLDVPAGEYGLTWEWDV